MKQTKKLQVSIVSNHSDNHQWVLQKFNIYRRKVWCLLHRTVGLLLHKLCMQLPTGYTKHTARKHPDQAWPTGLHQYGASMIFAIYTCVNTYILTVQVK